MMATKREAAKRLAILHGEAEPLLRRVFLLHSDRDGESSEPIKLLEVVDGAVEAGVMPIFFRADEKQGIEYPSVIVELSPFEYQQVERIGEIDVEGARWSVGEELISR